MICYHNIFIHIWSKAKQIERKRNWHFACNQMRIAYKIACGLNFYFWKKSTPIDQFDTNFSLSIFMCVCVCTLCVYRTNNYTNDLQLEHFLATICVICSLNQNMILFLSLSQKVERAKFNTHIQPNILHWFVEQQQKSAPISLICII